MFVALTSTSTQNCHVVHVGNLRLLFSYETVVAFDDGTGWVASENIWGRTTGKHLNQHQPVPSDQRLPNNEFMVELKKALDRLDLGVK